MAGHHALAAHLHDGPYPWQVEFIEQPSDEPGSGPNSSEVTRKVPDDCPAHVSAIPIIRQTTNSPRCTAIALQCPYPRAPTKHWNDGCHTNPDLRQRLRST